ncbi:hypothetical protein Dimus_021908 [Dionaea muscipula]
MISLSTTYYCRSHSFLLATNATTTNTAGESDPPTASSSYSSLSPGKIRRPKTLKPNRLPSPSTPRKIPSNPLKSILNPLIATADPHSLTNKLRLTSKTPPPPPPLPEVEESVDGDTGESPDIEFRQEGKIFVANLPLFMKKHEVTELFRQFGPIKNVILIKGHEDLEKNMGYGFVIYGGAMAEKSALRAVEFDGMEFHGRVLTVKLDDGRRLKMRGQREKGGLRSAMGGNTGQGGMRKGITRGRSFRRFWKPHQRTGRRSFGHLRGLRSHPGKSLG